MWAAWRSLAQLVLVLRVFGVLGAHDATYHNQFAVHVPNGERHVHDIAKRHGYVNHGQVLNSNPFMYHCVYFALVTLNLGIASKILDVDVW
ncbi:hypothetical protein RR46_09563 [Papilio xuthus]|uniref:Peptidase S8 pro-domain domain-containing protein n=1 Tax=Papilio xuthus TaxID=66420 RepID=A0A194PYD6_PAPXU|nr:hypothetical protein RR46_09563 [Papilio xuthus]